MNRIAAVVWNAIYRGHPIVKMRQLLGRASTLFVVAITLTAQETEKNPAALIGAQTQLRATMAEAWLHSDDPLKIAWGAWLARVDRQALLAPLLLRKVADYLSSGGITPQTIEKDRHDATLQVLDALIQLGVAVPVEEAGRLYPELTAQSLILLVRSAGDAQGAFLEIFDKANTNWTWLAAGNALLKVRPRILAARLLDRFTRRSQHPCSELQFRRRWRG
jgi:hypothetical protein